MARVLTHLRCRRRPLTTAPLTPAPLTHTRVPVRLLAPTAFSWVAPEIFRGEHYTEKVDVYSYAIVLWELFSFKKPHQDKDPIELPYLVGKKGLRPPPALHCPPTLRKLMASSWHENPLQRPSFQQILEALKSIPAEVENMDAPVDPTKEFGATASPVHVTVSVS